MYYIVGLVYFPNHYLPFLFQPSALFPTFISSPFISLHHFYRLRSCFFSTLEHDACTLSSLKISYFQFWLECYPQIE
jgi:hypothetical protein